MHLKYLPDANKFEIRQAVETIPQRQSTFSANLSGER